MNSSPDIRSKAKTSGAMRMLTGLAASRGFVAAPVFLFRTAGTEPVPECRIEPGMVSRELGRLADAFALTRAQIRSLSVELGKHISGDEAVIFEGHLMILDDPTFLSSCKEKISKLLCNAEWAVNEVAEKYTSIFAAMDDVYLKERSKDVGDIAKRIIRNLLGGDSQPLRVDQPCIVVADELTPSETITLPKHLVLGFATDRGSTTSHASVLARALGIPAVVGLGNLSEVVKTGDLLLLDGTRGKVIVNPGREERLAFEKMVARSRSLEEALDQCKVAPGATSDGHSVPFLANVDHSTPMTDLYAVGAEGIGLYRTEYLWLSMDREPTEDEQTHAYMVAVRALPDQQPVTIRVLDLGGDKMAKGASSLSHKEANPFLGNRSIRYLLRNPEVFRRQLRAILRVSAHGNVRLMYPMVSTIEELRAANLELHACMEQMRSDGTAFDENIKKGVMIEIPAAALIADALAKEADFFSVGTNDLIQYTLAVDRVNETVARLYQPTHPGVLQLIDMTVSAGHSHNLKVSVCGEMAADPVMAVLLLGMGVDEFSMSPNLIPLVKKIISQISLQDAQTLASTVRRMTGTAADKVYAYCRNQVMKLAPDLLYLQ